MAGTILGYVNDANIDYACLVGLLRILCKVRVRQIVSNAEKTLRSHLYGYGIMLAYTSLRRKYHSFRADRRFDFRVLFFSIDAILGLFKLTFQVLLFLMVFVAVKHWFFSPSNSYTDADLVNTMENSSRTGVVNESQQRNNPVSWSSAIEWEKKGQLSDVASEPQFRLTAVPLLAAAKRGVDIPVGTLDHYVAIQQWTNIRSEPNAAANIVKSLEMNSAVRITRIVGNWARVELIEKPEIKGFVSRELLVLDNAR